MGQSSQKNRSALLAALLLVVAGMSGCNSTRSYLFDAPEAPASIRMQIKPPPEMPGEAPPKTTFTAPPPARASEAPAAMPQTRAAPVAMPDPQEAVRSQLAAWRQAWASRDVPAYLAFYAPGFKAGESSPARWQATRQRVIGKAGEIELTLGRADIRQLDAQRVSASFTQQYRSNSKTDSGVKTLQFRLIDGQWLIEQESFSAAQR